MNALRSKCKEDYVFRTRRMRATSARRLRLKIFARAVSLPLITRTSNPYDAEMHCNCSVAPSKTCWPQACGASHLRGDWPRSVAETGREGRTNLSGALYSAPDKSGTPPDASHLRGGWPRSVAETGPESSARGSPRPVTPSDKDAQESAAPSVPRGQHYLTI